MADILLQQILFYSFYFYLSLTQVVRRQKLVFMHPPLLSMSGTILIRELLWMILTMLPENKLGRDMGFGHFSKLPQCKNHNVYIENQILFANIL